METNRWSYLPLAAGMLVLVLSLAVGVLTVTSKNTTNQSVTTKAANDAASISLSPATGTYNFTAGTTYPVGIVVDSGSKSIDGVDVIVNYDPTKVQVEGTKVATTPVFDQYPIDSVDNTKGVLKISGLTFSPKPLTGIIGTFRIRPLAKGEVNLTIQFTPGATTDSNVAGHDAVGDILGSVQNASYFFQ